MQAFELGIDLHAQTASLILGKPIEEVSDEDGSSSFGSGEYSERFWGKKANHAFNYGFGYRSFSMLYELPERESKFIHDRYHAGYPGIKANYWRLIQEMLGDNRTIINPFGRHIRLVDRWGEELFKQGYAALPQSTVADKINEHGLLFVCRNPEQFEQLLLTSQVHDSIVFQIPVAIGWAEHARMLLALLISLETPITFRGRTFVIHAEAKVGLSMGNYKKVKFTPTTPADQLAAQLEATYANLKS